MLKIKTVLLIIITTFVLISAGCIEDSVSDIKSAISTDSTVDITTTLNANSAENYEMAAANNAFAFDMYGNLKNNSENVFFSPYSIFTAMAMCYDGAEGSTKEQMANVFYFPLNKNVLEMSFGEMIATTNSKSDYYGLESYELETANALWINEFYPIKEQYISSVEDHFYGNARSMDFAGNPGGSKDTINKWVEEKTNDKISNIIPDGMINKNTRLIITNAVYFNGKWKYEFDEDYTSEREFYPSEDETILAETMFIQKHFNYGERSGAKILELPYKGNDLTMYVVLPDNNDIKNFEADFSVREYEKLKSKIDSEYDVKVWIPKFKFETKTELSNSLQEMGVTDAFGPANFSGISDKDLVISEVIHKAFVDVQEQGTEAAAATAVEFEIDDAMGPEPEQKIREFKADHPFIFFIEDKRTNCILFMGKIEYPEY